jgi:superoxide dismutase, Fe-Mn family
MFQLNKLPFKKNILEPIISQKTIEFHYDKHHQTYVNKLNDLIKNTDFENLSLEEIILKSYNKPDLKAVYNNAAQVYNHDFFWQSLKKDSQAQPSEKIIAKFSSLDNFKEEFVKLALAQFGSGWAWLVQDENNNLSLLKTANADNPLVLNLKPIFTIDVWEHAYYLDYQNKRADFVQLILDNLINWEFVNNNIN